MKTRASPLMAALIALAPAVTLAADTVSGAVPCQPKKDALWNCVLYDVSMVRLLANPGEFDGRRVRTVAYLDPDPAVGVVFLHQEDQQKLLHRNGVSLRDLPRAFCPGGGYVIVEGIFKAGDNTWLLPFAGSLDVLHCLPKI